MQRGETGEVDVGAEEGCCYACLGCPELGCREVEEHAGGNDRVRKGLRLRLRDRIFKSCDIRKVSLAII